MSKALPLDEFMQMAKTYVAVDVRSPGEFEQAGIPGSINIPLLDNEQRKIIGTIYKQKGNREAVLKGYELVGPFFYEKARQLTEHAVNNTLLMFCWRGGLRTRIMSGIATTCGIDVFFLKGGYKTYRTAMLQLNNLPLNGCIIGGKTGSGKTEMLQLLADKGHQVIDLEACASHRGSSFGALGKQPATQEQFENLIAMVRYHKRDNNAFWVLEDESRMIGEKCIPEALYNSMQHMPVIELQVDKETRIQRILNEYGKFGVDELAEATRRLHRRLGDENTRKAIELLQKGEKYQWVDLLLTYYDKAYDHNAAKRKNQREKFIFDWQNPEKYVNQLSDLIHGKSTEQGS